MIILSETQSGIDRVRANYTDAPGIERCKTWAWGSSRRNTRNDRSDERN